MSETGFIQLMTLFVNALLNPALIAVVVVVLFFRKEVKGLLDRIRSATIGPLSGQFADQLLGSPLNAPQPPLVSDEQAKNIDGQHEGSVSTVEERAHLENRVKELEEQLLDTRWSLYHETAYRIIHGGQISMLSFLRSRGELGAGEWELLLHQLQFSTSLPGSSPVPLLSELLSESFVAWPLSVGLMSRTPDGRYTITEAGARFLAYLAEQSIPLVKAH